MNSNLITLWCAELRSGNHKRAQTFMENGGYCPLGLLAKLNGFEMIPNKKPDGSRIKLLEEFNGKVTSSYGWPKTIENWPSYAVCDGVINMNAEERGKKYTFGDIADWIEKNI